MLVEQKRRQAIREGFDRLTEIVPGLEGQGRSEGLVLKKTVDYMREQLAERQELIDQVEAAGGTVDDNIKRYRPHCLFLCTPQLRWLICDTDRSTGTDRANIARQSKSRSHTSHCFAKRYSYSMIVSLTPENEPHPSLSYINAHRATHMWYYSGHEAARRSRRRPGTYQ